MKYSRFNPTTSFEKNLASFWDINDSDLEESDYEFKEFLKEIYIRLKERNSANWKYLGEGFNGFVFWIDNSSKVFKVTIDERDALASAIVQKKPDKNLIKVFDVFAFGLPYFKEAFGIVSEKLTPLSSSESKDWQEVIDFTRGKFDIFFKKPIEPMKFLEEDWLDLAEDLLAREDFSTSSKLISLKESLVTYLPEMRIWTKVLEKRGIQWGDMSVPNLRKRGRTTIIADLGAGYISSAPSIFTLDI